MMEYKLVRSKRKTISIVIDKNADVIVKAPNGVSQRYVEDFVNTKQDWIEKNVKKMSAVAKKRQPKKYDGGEIFMVFGKEYAMCISSVDDKIRIYEDKIFFPSKFLDNPNEHMVKWYIGIAKKYLVIRTEQIAAQLNLKYNKVKVTRADKRWGSCSSKKNINFSYKLIMANEVAVDYVIIHELCHLLHMNHSRLYWNSVASIMPRYKEQKKYLKTNEFKFIL